MSFDFIFSIFSVTKREIRLLGIREKGFQRVPSREPVRLRTFLVTEMTSGPIPSPGSRVMVQRFPGVVAEQQIVANLGVFLRTELERNWWSLNSLTLGCREAAMAELQENAIMLRQALLLERDLRSLRIDSLTWGILHRPPSIIFLRFLIHLNWSIKFLDR